jgi:hypothetical protein
MAERDLTGEAGEKIKAVGSNNENTDHVGGILQAEAEKRAQGRGDKGETREEEEKKGSHPDFYPEGMEDLFVIFVFGMEQSCRHG